MKRTQTILLGVLVLQLALAALTLWPRSTNANGNGGPLFPKLAASDVVALTVFDKPDTSINLAKQGDKWVLPDAGNFPADGSKISALLTKIIGITTDRLIATNASSQAQLQVAPDQYVHRIDVKTTDGTTRTLYMGSSPGSGEVNVRAGDQNNVFLGQNLNSSDASAEAGSWINPTYLTVTATEVSSFTLKNASGQLAFSKDSSGNWTLSDRKPSETMNQSAVTSLLGLVASLNMSAPLGTAEKPEYGMAHPGAVLTVQSKENNQNKTVTLNVGANKNTKDNTYVVKSSDSPYYVTVSEYNVDDMIQKKRSDFLQLPPTPTPGPTSLFGLPTVTPMP
jgi:hypothetical protein